MGRDTWRIVSQKQNPSSDLPWGAGSGILHNMSQHILHTWYLKDMSWEFQKSCYKKHILWVLGICSTSWDQAFYDQ